MRRFFLENSFEINQKISIKSTDAKHIKNVLRCNIDDILGFFDNDGYEYTGKILSLSKEAIEVHLLSKEVSKTESPVDIIVAQSFLKDKKMDTILRHLTELGITGFLPFFSERSVPSPDKKRLRKREERWSKIAIESVKQCERGKVPKIYATSSFDELMEFSKECDLKIVFWENEKGNFFDREKKAKKILIIIGPEGGFSEGEIRKTDLFGFTKTTLGPRILKAETAAIAATTLTQYFFGDLSNN
ncbi:MAG: 16S rRNA (uracil(1498)-N(3))-methyltransferase [Desulfobacterales bacterium]|nr:16S rRNA (uracil(1498)-N(3))-methyltransferase [Desulfobacterales bacterium]